MSGQRPSGWEDPEDAELDVTELPGETNGQLSEVAAFLASVPAPVLPDAIESRIAAALAAESAARGAETTPARGAETTPVRGADTLAPGPGPSQPRVLGPALPRPRVRRSLRLRPALVAGPLVACLLFAGLGYAISRGASSSSSSFPAAAPAGSSQAAAGSSSSGFSASRSESGAAAGEPVVVVTRSGTDYLAATLPAQVRATLAKTPPGAARQSGSSAGPETPAAGSAPVAEREPAAAASVLRDCVLSLTGGTPPRLVDRASYQGTAAYVIATASRVWVVGLGCTAAHHHLIASASLAS